MIGFHIQNSPQNWPEAVAKLPDNTPVKFVFGVERSKEARAANTAVKNWYRWVGYQPLPTAGSDLKAHCRTWLNQFIDGTFKREAIDVNFTQEYNETFANSQNETEREMWKDLHKTMAEVWATEYRTQPELKHIRLILAETSVGNDIPLGVARAAMQYDAIIGYHPYIVCRNKQVSPHDWRWYSGRWDTMDQFYRDNGVVVNWGFGEMGPVLDASGNWSGWLDPYGGWRHSDCLNGDINAYLNVLKYWLDNTTKTQAYKDGRIIGGVLFTSGAPGSGPKWQHFELSQPHMNTVADFVRNYPYPDKEPSMNWQTELWNESVKRQTISLNPDAALQAAMFKDGFTPVESEFRLTVDGVQYAAQAAEKPDGSKPRRVYYAVVPQWNNAQWFSEPTGLQAGDTVIDLSHHQAKLKPE